MIDRRLFLTSTVVGGCLAAATDRLRSEPLPATPPKIVPRPPAPAMPPFAVSRPAPTSAWINFEYEISWERMNVLQEIVTALIGKGVTEITLMISSSGGDLGAAISTFNFLTSAGIKLTTYNIGNAYSAAVILFLAGGRRVADIGAQFVIHPAAASMTSGAFTLADLGLRSEALDRDTSRMRDIIVARSRLTTEDVEPMLLKATFLGPRDAMRYGILTEIGHLDRPGSAALITVPLPRLSAPLVAR